jgi:multidrug resistance efflux pump
MQQLMEKGRVTKEEVDNAEHKARQAEIVVALREAELTGDRAAIAKGRLEAAKDDFDHARRGLERQLELLKRRIVAATEVDRAQSKVTAAKAALEAADQAMVKAATSAPATGPGDFPWTPEWKDKH